MHKMKKMLMKLRIKMKRQVCIPISRMVAHLWFQLSVFSGSEWYSRLNQVLHSKCRCVVARTPIPKH